MDDTATRSPATNAAATRTAGAAPASRKWLVLLAVGAAAFMSTLDSSIVNVCLPILRQAFGADLAEIEWVVTVYLLVVSALLLGAGRLGDLVGHRRVYLGGFAGFIGASALCGAAPSLGVLVAARGLQAIGASMIFATAPAILVAGFPAEERGRALGLQATMTYLGLTVGPPLGGWLASAFSWRAIFYVNVPVGGAALFLAWRFVPRAAPPARGERFDLAGAALFTAGLVALLLALDEGHAWGWSSPPVVGLLATSALALGAFVAWQRRAAHPMLDLRLFRSRVLSLATASAFLNYVALYHVVFVLPFYLIQARGLAPPSAGLLLAVQAIAMTVSAPLSGAASDRIGTRAPAAAGMATLSVGLAVLSRVGPATPLGLVAAGLALTGAGTGAFIAPNNSSLLGAAPPQRRGVASGVLAEARTVGMVVGVGIAGAVMSTALARAAEPGPAALADAAGASLLVAAAIAAAGVVTSAVRAAR